MKQVAAILLFASLTGGSAFAHQMEGGSAEGLFGLKAEYVHVLLNPLPVYGLAMGIMALIGGWFTRSKAAQVVGLILIVLCSSAAWPTLYYGQHGYNHLAPQLDDESKQWLDVHMDRAERFIYAFYITAILGIAALVTRKKSAKASGVLTAVTCASALVSLEIGGWISRAGGEVSHSEFRAGEAPANAPSHDHQHGPAEQSHDKMNTTETDGKRHDHAGQNVALPDTPEAIWKELHMHGSELEAAIEAKRFDDIQSHTAGMNDLTTRLVSIVHPDHRVSVRRGAEKINRAADNLRQAARAGNQGESKENFKQLNAALTELEEQMKKQ